MPDPTDLKSHVVAGANLTTASGHALSNAAKLRLRSQLKNALTAELAAAGSTAGLKPGDKVAISSSIGQSISF
jgi:hypothetical protein